ncbi:50S ribosomal protein L21 [Aliifodinibius sp. S!AR15-10]|uniref:50S ribosomal protein L21 n=1 Tax=Aliifodinibius sp. S!AR15-10 TaxID=2950437 RepID=UPI0028548763|nr:50S ribosomal protein L21 [Aliifodinibius sp. S!AR15-10]MDR8392145.1 50S ribosomal protein L21 [Aliifodinibius sp. S!AR15-10]
MYAVVEIGGHQYKVSEGDVLFVDKQADETGGKLTFDRVLLINDDGNVDIGQPVVEGASIEATLLDNVKSDKVIVFKKKRRKGYRVKRGHRQPMSQIEIKKIATSGSGGTSKSKASQKEAETETTEETSQVSTDMTAKEAISHIRNTPLEELKGFVPEDEDRVTVLDAWDSKQEG